MGTMHVFCRKSYVPAAVHEIIPIDVIHVAVAVVINPVSRNLPGIDPHVVFQVLVIIFHSLVNHSHNNVRIAGA